MAKEKAKPKKTKKEDFSDLEDQEISDNQEIEDYSEVNNDFSDNEMDKQQEGNIFGKIYRGLEDRYFAFSDWLGKKGIGLNKLNDFLEDKGIPSFAF
ncbi:MAG: hypothetical protein WCX73_00875, partial [Candidatus Pacearchaeota archaeon]